jgi:CRISPR/Cas system-associated exonuclease Cas4 (RecB family)
MAEETIPTRPAMGTRRHEWSARLTKLATTVERIAAGCPAEDWAAVSWCLEQDDRLRLENPDAIELIEYTVDLAPLGIPKGGTIDFGMVYAGGHAVLVDRKFGALPADAPKWNWQMKAYACGLAHTFGCTSVTAAIAQPELEESKRWRMETWDAKQLAGFADQIRAIVTATESLDAPLIPSDRACQYCKARKTCSARAAVAAEVALIKDPVAAFKALALPDRPRMWDRLALAIDVLSKAQSAIEAEAIAGGIEIPGYAVGEGKKGNRQWTDADAAEVMLRRLCHEQGKNSDLAVTRKVLSPSEAEKLVGKAVFTKAADGLVKQDRGKPALVRVAL